MRSFEEQTVTEIDVNLYDVVLYWKKEKLTQPLRIDRYQKIAFLFSFFICATFIFQQTVSQTHAKHVQKPSSVKQDPPIKAAFIEPAFQEEKSATSEVEIQHGDLPEINGAEQVEQEAIEVTTVDGVHVRDFEIVSFKKDKVLTTKPLTKSYKKNTKKKKGLKNLRLKNLLVKD